MEGISEKVGERRKKHQYGTSWKNMKNIGAYIEEYRGTWRNKKHTTHGTWWIHLGFCTAEFLQTVFIQVLGEQEQRQAWQWQWLAMVSCGIGIIDVQPSLSMGGEYDASWDPGVVHKKCPCPMFFWHSLCQTHWLQFGTGETVLVYLERPLDLEPVD